MIKNLHFVVELRTKVKHNTGCTSASSGRAVLGEASGCQFLASEKKCPAWRVDGPRSSYDSLSFA